MNLSWRRPPAEAMRRFLAPQAARDFSYAAVGATAGQPPAGFVVDHHRSRLGEGEAVFQAAADALRQWKQYDLGWMEAWSPETSIRAGQVVAIAARVLGLWSLNACKIVYVVDEAGPIRRYGLACGTLPAHAGRGEERFLVEWDRAEGGVWYDILAFSRPNGLLARLGYPVVRLTQKRFGRDSAAAVKRASSRSSS